MAKYMTKQRKILIDFLSLHADEILSAGQISSEIASGEISISAVYRNLSSLEKEGLVKRVSKAGTREVFFRYTDAPECRESLHLSCKKCGKTFHMKHSGAEKLIKSVSDIDGFSIDKTKTVLYGLCKNCRG